VYRAHADQGAPAEDLRGNAQEPRIPESPEAVLMPEDHIHRHINERADYLIIGTPGKGGEIRVHFDSGDLNDACRRVDVAVQVREHMLERLAAGGQRV
jgi:hypothetical protein